MTKLPNRYRITDTPRRASLYYSAQTEKIPPGMPKRERRIRFHVVFYVALGMVIVYSVMSLWVFVAQPFVTNLTIQWHYGDRRVSLFGADVGHGGVSRFIAFEDGSEIVVVEVVAKRYTVYTIPVTAAPNQLITLSVSDVNGDGKPDLLVHVNGTDSSFALLNNGSAFSWSHE